jgi:Flp pilus assembly protein TadG
MNPAALRAVVRSCRRGTTTVELALVLPVFLTLVLGLIQVCHAQMIEYVLKSACRNAARYGSAGGVTSAQTEAKVRQIAASGMDPDKILVLIKQGDAFQDDATMPSTTAEYQALPDIELSSAEPKQLFVIRASVAYNDVAILSLPYCSGITISAESLIRHE